MPGVRMTEMWCKQVKPDSCQKDYYDSWIPIPGQSGKLVMRVGTNGTKTWMLLYWFNKRKRRFSLGHYPAMNLPEARKKSSQILSEIIGGADPATQRSQERGSPTFKDIADEYIKYHAEKRKKHKSLEEDLRMLAKDLLPAWGERKAKDIKRRDVIDLLDGIVDRGAPIAANRTLALASKIYNVAIDRELAEINPCYRVTPPGNEIQRDRVLTYREIKLVWDSFVCLQPLMKGLFQIRMLTAQRGAEVVSMRWVDVELDNGWWTIPKEVTKNKLSHRVPLTSFAVAILHELKMTTGREGWCFPSARSTLGHIYNVKKATERLREVSGVNDFRPHDLRRTAASTMTGLGVPRLVVSKVLNHVEEGITAVYDRHSYDAEKREALELWSKKLEEIILS